jgi:hypothetical protein
MIAFIIIGLPLFAQEDYDIEKEKAAIIETALNYIEGWYEGNVERMDKALHPDLMKRFMQPMPTGKEVTNTVSKKSMLEYTRAGAGTNSPNKDKKPDLEVLDIFKTIAAVKCKSGDYMDYLHLAKTEGEWKIMNVLWVPLNPRPQR